MRNTFAKTQNSRQSVVANATGGANWGMWGARMGGFDPLYRQNREHIQLECWKKYKKTNEKTANTATNTGSNYGSS